MDCLVGNLTSECQVTVLKHRALSGKAMPHTTVDRPHPAILRAYCTDWAAELHPHGRPLNQANKAVSGKRPAKGSYWPGRPPAWGSQRKGDYSRNRVRATWCFSSWAKPGMKYTTLGSAMRAARPWSWEKPIFSSHADEQPLPWLVAFLNLRVLFGISVTLTTLEECARGFMTITFNGSDER